MKSEEFFELMSEVDDGFIERSERGEIVMKKGTSLTWLRAGALAACVCITAAVGFAFLHRSESGLTELTGGAESEIITTDISVDAATHNIRVEFSEGRGGYGLSRLEIDKDDPRYDEPYYVREDAEPTRTITLLGKTVTAKYVETCEWFGADPKDYYTDEEGNSYTFAEDGTLLSYIGESELEGFSVALYADKGIAPDITEDEAVAIAEKTGEEVFGEAFDKVKLESVSYRHGIYDVEFHQRLGADGSLLGLSCHVSVLANGTPYFYSMADLAAFRDLDESKYELVTKEMLEEIAAEQYGVDAAHFYDQEYISICKKHGKYVVQVMAELRTPGTEEILFEVTDFVAE